MHKCPNPNCDIYENGYYQQIIKCKCGIYKKFITSISPHWIELKLKYIEKHILKHIEENK